VKLPADFVLSRGYLSAVEEAARGYKNAEMVMRATLKGNGAPCAYKDERNERNSERNEEASPGPPVPSVVIEKSLPSVGRSVSVAVETPEPETTDRPKEVSKSEVKAWMEDNLTVPGFRLQDPELNAVWVTVPSRARFEHFKKAARSQKEARGWKVFVTIAQNCAERYEQYSKAAAAGAGAEVQKQDPLVQKLREIQERRKSCPTN
jgi:hypothetical protein